MSKSSFTPTCKLCATLLEAPLYEAPGSTAITSLSTLSSNPVTVYFCQHCGHLQTPEMAEVADYYDKHYNILTDSDEEDLLYKVIEERKVFRIEHQAETLLNKLTLPFQARILDYGCAKSATLRKLQDTRRDLKIHLFDVSDAYIAFWEKFISADNWAIYTPKPEWQNSMDVVTSFFSLEHVVKPKETLQQIANLLKPGGLFYAIIPNVLENIADFIVSDHVHHYTEPSIRYLFQNTPLDLLELDTHSHDGAFIIIGQKTITQNNSSLPEQTDSIAKMAQKLIEIKNYWVELDTKINQFEAVHSGKAAIYGAGFWGTYIASRLSHWDNLRCFLDQNPFLQGKQKEEKPVLSPKQLPDGIQTLYVGLAPSIARDVIAGIPALQNRKLNYFFT
jgi:SAM-dependent methyltransferase